MESFPYFLSTEAGLGRRTLTGIHLGLAVVLEIDGKGSIVLRGARLLHLRDDKLALQVGRRVALALEAGELHALACAPQLADVVQAEFLLALVAESLAMDADAHLRYALAAKEGLLGLLLHGRLHAALLRLSVEGDGVRGAMPQALAADGKQHVAAVHIVLRYCHFLFLFSLIFL